MLKLSYFIGDLCGVAAMLCFVLLRGIFGVVKPFVLLEMVVSCCLLTVSGRVLKRQPHNTHDARAGGGSALSRGRRHN